MRVGEDEHLHPRTFPTLRLGDEKALGTSGQVIEGGIKNTDPARENRPLYAVTAERVQFYDGPKQGVSEAEQRDQWVREPLTVTFTSFE